MTLDDRLAQNIAIRGFESINGDGEYFGNLDDNSIEVIKQAILSDLLEIIPKEVDTKKYKCDDSEYSFMLGYIQACIEIEEKVRKYCE